jgi:hypothetical protein
MLTPVAQAFAARSIEFPGTIPVGLGDGSVHTVSAGVSQDSWQRAVMPRDGATFDNSG